MIGYTPTYRYIARDANDTELARVLIEHYGDEKMRTVLVDPVDFMHLTPMRVAELLNGAYEAGRKHAYEDLDSLIKV